MSAYRQLPGRLDLAIKSGDDFSANVDFSISLSGVTMASTIASVVSGATVSTIATSFQDAANGIVNISLSDTQTSTLSPGTYRWSMAGTQGSLTRTYLEGYIEVTR